MYYDLLPKIKNAAMAKKEKITVPFSRMDLAVSNVLVAAGYLKSAQKESAGKRAVLEIKLAYKNKRPALGDFKLVAKPSRHFYAGWRNIQPVKNGHGLAVFSTPKGIMSGAEARKNKVGGEYLFEAW